MCFPRATAKMRANAALQEPLRSWVHTETWSAPLTRTLGASEWLSQLNVASWFWLRS